MNSYKEMYLTLFDAITKTIDLLVRAQQEAEALFASMDEEHEKEE